MPIAVVTMKCDLTKAGLGGESLSVPEFNPWMRDAATYHKHDNDCSALDIDALLNLLPEAPVYTDDSTMGPDGVPVRVVVRVVLAGNFLAVDLSRDGGKSGSGRDDGRERTGFFRKSLVRLFGWSDRRGREAVAVEVGFDKRSGRGDHGEDSRKVNQREKLVEGRKDA